MSRSVAGIQQLGHRLRSWRLEIKYALITGVLLSALYSLSHSGTLAGVQERIITLIDATAGYGLAGLFVGALLANLAVMISVPYTAIVVAVALASHSLLDMLIICVVTGLGSGLGKIITYALARNIAAGQQNLEYSPLLVSIRTYAEEHPRAAPLLVFLAAFTVLPDDWVMVPLALVQYPLGKTVVPMLTGKVLHGLSLIFIVLLAVDPEDMAARSKADLTLAVLIVSLVVVLYQIEHNLQKRREAARPSPPAGDAAR
ncbi:MAG: hypothetical protein HRF48_11070 [Chloroflexota bacterium]|jgi:membrane protein YqaA with SNARE-associated domain